VAQRRILATNVECLGKVGRLGETANGKIVDDVESSHFFCLRVSTSSGLRLRYALALSSARQKRGGLRAIF
jgi:hypothetical protein